MRDTGEEGGGGGRSLHSHGSSDLNRSPPAAVFTAFLLPRRPHAALDPTDGTEAAVRGAGRLRMEGQRYEVVDGDILHFKFNVSKGK